MITRMIMTMTVFEFDCDDDHVGCKVMMECNAQGWVGVHQNEE